jgi:hypothetical protein
MRQQPIHLHRLPVTARRPSSHRTIKSAPSISSPTGRLYAAPDGTPESLRSARQDVTAPRHPHKQRRRTCGMRGKHPTDRVRRNRLAEHGLDRCMDMRDPHRPDLVGEHLKNHIEHPTGPTWPPSPIDDPPRRHITGPQNSQLLCQPAQRPL